MSACFLSQSAARPRAIQFQIAVSTFCDILLAHSGCFELHVFRASERLNEDPLVPLGVMILLYHVRPGVGEAYLNALGRVCINCCVAYQVKLIFKCSTIKETRICSFIRTR